jgi:hypothetical protein
MGLKPYGRQISSLLLASCVACAAFGQGRGGRSANDPAAAAPRLPVDPYLGLNSGKPDLGGKGFWDIRYITDMSKARAGVTKATDVPFNAKGKKIFDQRVDTVEKDDPQSRCLPPGPPRLMYTPHPIEILQMPDHIVIIYETQNLWRYIWMDGRQHPKDPNPTYLGDSVGHWDGDTLVVDVVGFNDVGWLDFQGHPHGEKLHIVEKYTRPDFHTLHYEATIEDPEYHTEPWTVPMNVPWVPGQEKSEYVCDNNRDVEHLVGK